MCLYSNDMQPRVAEKPITVYKILYKSDTNGVYQTPFQGKVVCPEILNGEEPFIAEGEKQVKTTTSVGKGFIHTYGNFPTNEDSFTTKYSVFKCEIPSGSLYWTNENNTEYASEQIVFKNLEFESEDGTFSTVLKKAAKFGKLTSKNLDEINRFWKLFYLDVFAKNMSFETKSLYFEKLCETFQNIAIQYVNGNWETFITDINNRTNVSIFDEEKILRYADKILSVTKDVELASDLSKIYKTVQDIYNVAKENDIWKYDVQNYGETCLYRKICETLPEILTKTRDKKTDENLEFMFNRCNVEIERLLISKHDRDKLFKLLLPEETN